MDNVTVESVNPGHHHVFLGDRWVGVISRTIRSGLREWHVRDNRGRSLRSSFYFKTAREFALSHNWEGVQGV